MKKGYSWLNHVLNFIAVILGVFFAFYINERANSSEEGKERLLLVQSMINDISADIKSYEEYLIPVNITYKENLDTLLLLLANEDIVAINNQLPTIFQVENFAPNTAVYNSIKSSGKIKLLEDIDLQKTLSDYYDGVVVECVGKNKLQADFFIDNLLDWLVLNADMMEMKLLDEANLLVFRNTLIVYQAFVEQKVQHYELIVEESGQLKDQLNAYIEVVK